MKNNEKKTEYINIKDTARKPPSSAHSKGLTPLQRGKHVAAVIGTTLLTIFLILVITICIVAVAVTVYIMQFAENSFDIDLTDVELSMSSFVYAYDKDGNEVELKQLHTDENRVWVDIDDLQQHTIDAFVATEDKRFYEHDGVDWFRTIVVTVEAMFKGGQQGASTITQQLVRDVTNDNSTTAGRKLREIFRALSLEQKYSKLDILESYINRVSFGGTSYGIGSAAKHYYDKEASELTIAESAMLSGILRSPGVWNPYVNPEKARERLEYSLRHMHEQGLITTQEYESALAEKVYFRKPIEGNYFNYVDERYNEYYGILDESVSAEEEDLYYENLSWDELKEYTPYKWNGSYTVTQSYYVDAAINQIIEHLAAQMGVSEASAKEMFYKGGYKAYLNVDLDMQNTLEEKFVDPLLCLNGYDEAAEKSDLLQAAFAVMDYRGNVKAVVGGIGEKEGDGTYNRATQSRRSAGSTIKPLSVYSLAIDRNVINYSTMLHDISGEIPHEDYPFDESKRKRWPTNYEQNFPGTGNYYPAWYAVQKSLNTAAVRVLQMVGRENSFAQLTNRLGFSTLDPVNDMSWSPLALGAFTDGVKLIELTAAYQIIGNGGIYYEPYFYSKVVDSNDKVILEQNYTGVQAIAQDSAWITNRMMKMVVEDTSGTGRHSKLPNVEVIGKTGTANDMSNLIYAGLTPEYVATYRVGYDELKTMDVYNAYTGWKTLARVWHDVMIDLVDTSVEMKFSPDPTTLELSYCNESGLRATSTCPSTSIGYYRASFIPTSCDSKHDGTYWETHGDAKDFIPFYN